jgi:hypothetical protein
MGMLQHIWIDVIFVSFSSPSPSSKHKQVAVQEEGPECRDEFSSGSLAGSLASGSSGFGSLSKKRAPVFPSGVSSIRILISCVLCYSFVSQDLVTATFVRNISGFFISRCGSRFTCCQVCAWFIRLHTMLLCCQSYLSDR